MSNAIATLTGPEIREILEGEWGIIEREIVCDFDYSLPSKVWLTDQFADFLKRRIGQWTSEEDDCDDAAEDGRYYARKLHQQTPRDTKSAIAFGVVQYRREVEQDVHIKNFAIVVDAGEYQVVIYEPRNQTIGAFTESEKQNVLYWLI